MPDLAWRTTREAEHAALGLAAASKGGEVLRMATHFATSGGAVLVTVETDRSQVSVLGAESLESEAAVQEAQARRLHVEAAGGRLFRFPGWDALVGVLSVRDVLSRTDIDAVVMVGHREPLDPDALLDTQAFVRPTMSGGRTELVVRPAADGLVVPFEQPNPTPCCSSH
jgi:hypothetical protein